MLTKTRLWKTPSAVSAMSTISGKFNPSPPAPLPSDGRGWLSRPGEGRAAEVEVFHRRDADDGGGINGVLAVCDGGDVEDGTKRMSKAELRLDWSTGWLGEFALRTSKAGVVAERAFVAQRLGRVNVAFDDEVGVGQNRFQFGQNVFRASANSEKTIPLVSQILSIHPSARSIKINSVRATAHRLWRVWLLMFVYFDEQRGATTPPPPPPAVPR